MKIEITTVKMQDGTTKLKIISPYAPDLPAAFKRLGGKWSPAARAWYLDPRDGPKVREILAAAFGAPGEDTMTLRVDLALASDEGEDRSEFRACGRTLAWRRGRDAAVTLGEGVIIVAGGFHAWGGSVKRPSIGYFPGTILEVRDVPRTLAERYMATSSGVTVVSQSAPTPASPPDPVQMRDYATADDAARAIVETGLRELAKKCHPDVGGNVDDMKTLNQAADQLRQMLKLAQEVS